MRPFEDVEAEQAFLGALLLDASLVTIARTQVTPEMLSRDQHRMIYTAILDLGDAADSLTVTHRVAQAGKLEDVGGASYITSLMNAVPTALNCDHYADVVREVFLQRRIHALAPEVESLAAEKPADALATIRALVRDIEKSLPQQPRVVALEDRFPSVWEDIQRRAAHEDVPGIPYGFPTLDRATGGMMPGEFILVNGVTGTGKSALLQHFWECAGRRGPALVCTNEMTVLHYAQRVLARRARVDVLNLRNPRYLTQGEEQRLSRAMGELAKVRNRYFVAEATFTVDAIRAAIEDVRDRGGGCVWVGIDWLQLLRIERVRARDGRTAELDAIVGEIQELATTYAIPAVVVAQYDKASSRAGDLSPLGSRGSSMIGQASFVSVAIQYDDKDETALQRTGRLVISKSRMGPRVEERVTFEGAFVTFRPLDVRHAALREGEV